MDRFDGFAKIYALTDRNNVPFYVGCTVQELMTRRTGHITEARKNHRYTNAVKNEKIRSLDFKIRIRLLFLIHVKAETKHLAQRSCYIFERYWLKRFLKKGYQLCNGNGIKGIKKRQWKPETILEK